MFDNINTVDNATTTSSNININLFEDSYSNCDKVNPSSLAGSQSADWSNDGTRFNLGRKSSNMMLSVPSLELIDSANLIPEKLRAFDNQSDLAQAPTEKENKSAKLLEDLTKYAGDNNLTFSKLDAVGINNVSQSWQRVVDNCPKNGEVKQTETGGQFTGLTTVGLNGQRIPGKTGQTIDRYFKNDDGFSWHTSTVNTLGVLGEAERAMETENHTKIYVHNQLPANGAVRVDVLLPDGKSGVQINAQSSQLKEILKRINQADKEQTLVPAS